jgi:hypothetical protein
VACRATGLLHTQLEQGIGHAGLEQVIGQQGRGDSEREDSHLDGGLNGATEWPRTLGSIFGHKMGHWGRHWGNQKGMIVNLTSLSHPPGGGEDRPPVGMGWSSPFVS